MHLLVCTSGVKSYPFFLPLPVQDLFSLQINSSDAGHLRLHWLLYLINSGELFCTCFPTAECIRERDSHCATTENMYVFLCRLNTDNSHHPNVGYYFGPSLFCRFVIYPHFQHRRVPFDTNTFSVVVSIDSKLAKEIT